MPEEEGHKLIMLFFTVTSGALGIPCTASNHQCRFAAAHHHARTCVDVLRGPDIPGGDTHLSSGRSVEK